MIILPIWSGYVYCIINPMPAGHWCTAWQCYGRDRKQVESAYRSALDNGMSRPAYRVICRRKR